jgi:hypothetical protein
MSWNGENGNRFAEIAEEILLPMVQKDVCFTVPHQSRERLRTDGNFYIHIWSCFSGHHEYELVTPPSKIYGFEVDCRDEAFRPKRKKEIGKVFLCPGTSYEVAELIDNNLFIHHDICHKGTLRELAIFKQLLLEVTQELRPSSEKIAARLGSELKEMREKKEETRGSFEALYLAELLKRTREDEEALIVNARKVEKIKEEMANLLAKRTAAIEQLEKYSGMSSLTDEAHSAEFDKLLAIPGVLGVQIEKDTLKVYTQLIRIVEDDVTYRIGRFRIEISMIGKEPGLKFFNLTNKGRGPGYDRPRDFNAASDYNRHHPHVNEEGVPCLGNLKEAIPRYVQASQFSVVTILAMQFLATANVEDKAGRGLKWWPKETN